MCKGCKMTNGEVIKHSILNNVLNTIKELKPHDVEDADVTIIERDNETTVTISVDIKKQSYDV